MVRPWGPACQNWGTGRQGLGPSVCGLMDSWFLNSSYPGTWGPHVWWDIHDSRLLWSSLAQASPGVGFLYNMLPSLPSSEAPCPRLPYIYTSCLKLRTDQSSGQMGSCCRILMVKASRESARVPEERCQSQGEFLGSVWGSFALRRALTWPTWECGGAEAMSWNGLPHSHWVLIPGAKPWTLSWELETQITVPLSIKHSPLSEKRSLKG